MHAYPWDLYDEGVQAAFDRLQACGIDGIQLAVSYHIATYLLPRNPKKLLYYGHHGAVYFRPDPQLYRAAVIQPVVAEAVDREEYLETLLEGARAREISAMPIS